MPNSTPETRSEERSRKVIRRCLEEGRLGDAIEEALSRAGITSRRVRGWIGADCGCEERKARLNALGAWAVRFLRGKTEGMIGYLETILGSGNED